MKLGFLGVGSLLNPAILDFERPKTTEEKAWHGWSGTPCTFMQLTQNPQKWIRVCEMSRAICIYNIYRAFSEDGRGGCDTRVCSGQNKDSTSLTKAEKARISKMRRCKFFHDLLFQEETDQNTS